MLVVQVVRAFHAPHLCLLSSPGERLKARLQLLLFSHQLLNFITNSLRQLLLVL